MATKARDDGGARARSPFALELLDDRYPSLHGLRVLGILSVIQVHVTLLFDEERLPLTLWARRMSYRVFFGMDLFFVLSGFLIGSILFRALDGGRTLDLRRFYVRRALRTFPPYYVVLVGLALLGPLTAAQRVSLPYELAFLSNFRSLEASRCVMPWGWSLAFEEQFYLVVPFVVGFLAKLVQPRARLTLLVALVLAALAIRFGVWSSKATWDEADLRNLLYFRPYARFDTLAAGIAIALVHREWGPQLTAWLAHPRARGLFAVGALACLWLLMDPITLDERGQQAMHLLAWGTITSVMYFFVVILLLHAPPSPITRFLAAPMFRRMATLGYGVYLVHFPLCSRAILPLAVWCTKRGTPMWVLWPAAVVVLFLASLLVAYVIHLVIEKPFLRLRDRIGA